MSGRIGGGGGRWRWLKKGMTPCTGVNRCTMLSLSISFFLFLFFSPSILSLSLSRYSLVIDRTLMRFVIGVCTDCTPSYERTLPPNTHTYAVVLYTCVYVPGRRLRAPPIFMVRYGTKIKEISRIASRYSLVNTSLACFVSRKRIVGIHSGRSRIDFSM